MLAQTACTRVRYRFARYARQRRGRFGTRFCEGWSFLLRAVRQTDRQTNKQIWNYPLQKPRRLGKPRIFFLLVYSSLFEGEFLKTLLRCRCYGVLRNIGTIFPHPEKHGLGAGEINIEPLSCTNYKVTGITLTAHTEHECAG